MPCVLSHPHSASLCFLPSPPLQNYTALQPGMRSLLLLELAGPWIKVCDDALWCWVLYDAKTQQPLLRQVQVDLINTGISYNALRHPLTNCKLGVKPRRQETKCAMWMCAGNRSASHRNISWLWPHIVMLKSGAPGEVLWWGTHRAVTLTTLLLSPLDVASSSSWVQAVPLLLNPLSHHW